MKNETLLAMVHELVAMKGNDMYAYEKRWCELYEECVKELRKLVSRRNYHFTSEYSQEDFEQDVMIKIFTKLHKFNMARANFKTWVWRMGINVYVDLCRERMQRMKDSIIHVPMYIENDDKENCNVIDLYFHSESMENDYLYKEACERLYGAIEHLNDNYRRVVELCDIKGLTPGEACKVLGKKREDVYVWKNRAHAKLEKMIVEKEMEEDFFHERD